MLLYHRTKKKNAKSIIKNGFRLKSTSKRIECGNGIYCVTSLSDANKPYMKKTYGNYLIEITIPDNLVWEFGKKTEFMKFKKDSNKIYNVEYIGKIAVLFEIEKIEKVKII